LTSVCAVSAPRLFGHALIGVTAWLIPPAWRAHRGR
jgi:hypothetical protein